MNEKNSVSLRGRVKIYDATSGVLLVCGDNIITNQGKLSTAFMIAGPLTGSSPATINKISIGNGGASVNGLALVPTESDDSLGYSLTDAIISSAVVAEQAAVKTVTFSAILDASAVGGWGGGTSNVVNEVGLMTTDGKLFARKTFDNLSFDPDVPDKVQIVWSIYVP